QTVPERPHSCPRSRATIEPLKARFKSWVNGPSTHAQWLEQPASYTTHSATQTTTNSSTCCAFLDTSTKTGTRHLQKNSATSSLCHAKLRYENSPEDNSPP